METNIEWSCERSYVPVYYGKVGGVTLFTVHPVVRTANRITGVEESTTELFVLKTLLPGLPLEITRASPFLAMSEAELLWVNWVDKMGLFFK